MLDWAAESAAGRNASANGASATAAASWEAAATPPSSSAPAHAAAAAALAEDDAALEAIEAEEERLIPRGYCGLLSRPRGVDWRLLAEGAHESRSLLREFLAADGTTPLGVRLPRHRWQCARSFPRRLDGVRCERLAPRVG